MTDEQLKEAGVPAELIRISLGLEDKEDLIADNFECVGCDQGLICRKKKVQREK